MSFRSYILLFLSGLILPVALAQFQPTPGYLDSDYYYAGGIQLATGRGFTEPYLWNYLDDPQSLPHPSHNYWMPLSSILAALGMWLTGKTDYASARIPFIVVAALIPPLTAALAYQFSKRRDLAITSAILAIFSVYHAPFVGVTDNFSPYMLFGGLYFLVVTNLRTPTRIPKSGDSGAPSNDESHQTPMTHWNPNLGWLLLGIISGLLTLSRSDGLLWLTLTFLLAIWKGRGAFRFAVFALIGFLLVMSPWYARNFNLYGSIMPPGGSRALWLDNYDQTFSFPASQLTMQSFLALGWKEIVSDRLWALGNNLQSGFAAHGGIILFPFIVIGIIQYRKDERVKLGVVAWLILFAVMTVIFPFAGARGAFFHAGASLQPLWWTLAPLGLESIVEKALRRGMFDRHAQLFFRGVLVFMTVLLTFYVVYLRIFSLGWGESEGYDKVEKFLLSHGIGQNDVVIIRNPVGYYTTNHRSAIAIPYGDEQTFLALSDKFHARYLVIEPEAALPMISDLFKNPHDHGRFDYLGEVDGAQVYEIIE